MKQQQGFNWFKFVTTSMVVVGVGFFLLSLILSKYIWKDEDLQLDVSEDYQKANTLMPTQVPKSNVAQSDASKNTNDLLDNIRQVDEMLAWLESLESQDKDSAAFSQESPMESLDAWEGDIDEIPGEVEIAPSTPQVSEAEIARLREEIEDTADQYWDVLTELKLAFTTSYVPPDPDRLDEEYLDLQIEITDLLVSYFDYTRNVDEFNPGGEIYNLFSGMVETSADDDMCYLTFTGEILYGNP